MKVFYTFFFLACFSVLTMAQTGKPLIQTPFLDTHIAFEALDDGSFVSLEGVAYHDMLLHSSYTKPASVLKKYNAAAVEMAAYAFVPADSSKFIAKFLKVLDDGRFLVGGLLQKTPSLPPKSVLKIISKDLQQEVLEISANVPLSLFIENAFLDNDTIVSVYSNNNKTYKRIIRFDLQGNTLYAQNVNTSVPSNSYNSYVSSFYLNHTMYLPSTVSSWSPAIDTSFMVSVDNQNSFKTIDVIDTFQLNSKKVLFDFTGCLYKENHYLIAARIKRPNTSAAHLAVFQFSEDGSIDLFFEDTTLTCNENNTFRGINLVSKTPNNIYVSIEDISENGKTSFYNIAADGSLKWKKSIALINEQPIVNLPLSYQTTCATYDGDLIFSYQMNDSYQNHGVYYYKLDSLGNFKDFATGIFAAPKLAEKQFALHPNPAHDFVRIKTELAGTFSIRVFDALGKLVQQRSIKNQDILKLVDYKKGIYFYQIFSEDEKTLEYGSFLKD